MNGHVLCLDVVRDGWASSEQNGPRALVVLRCDGVLGVGEEWRHRFSHQRAMVPCSRSLSWKGEAAAELEILDFSLPLLWSNF